MRGLVSGETGVEPEQVHALYELPSRLVAVDLAGTLAIGAATLAPWLRPETNDLSTQAELVLLAITMASVAALPAYIAMRTAVARTLELVAVASAREAIERIGSPEKRTARVRQRLLAAVAPPVAFVAVGGSLPVHPPLHPFDRSPRHNHPAGLTPPPLH